MSAETVLPKLWGIDPDISWKWTPAEFHANSEEWDAAVKEERAKIVDDKDGEKWRVAMDGLLDRFKHVPMPILDGAPIFDLGPLPERLAFRIQAAQTVANRLLWAAKEELKQEKKRVEESGFSEEEKAARIDAATRKERAAYIRESESVYDPELISATLSACLKGWSGMVREFSGSWEKDSKVIPPAWKMELFHSIRTGTAYSETEQAGFSLPRASSSV